MTERQPGGWKEFFGADTAQILGETIVDVYPSFDVEDFVQEVAGAIQGLELKARVKEMTAALRKRLPDDYVEAMNILMDSLGPELEEGQGMFTHGWYLMPVARFVEEYGLDNPGLSIEALHEITRRHTAEYAVRPYLVQHYDLTMAKMRQWVRDPSCHVRRLVSEGTRPRLPWARRLDCFIHNPEPILELLTQLCNDPSEYVRKSVANSLNDISKDHPEVALETAEHWVRISPTPGTLWIVRHGLRTLIKQGNSRALALMGVTSGDHIKLDHLDVMPRHVVVGESLRFSFDLYNLDDQVHQLTVDYIVHFARSKGRTNGKVFKLTTTTLESNMSQHIEKGHSFKPTSVRRYYPGMHRIEVQVNGRVLGGVNFELCEPVLT